MNKNDKITSDVCDFRRIPPVSIACKGSNRVEEVEERGSLL